MNELQKKVDIFKMKYESFLIGCDSIEEMELWDKNSLGEMEAFYSNDMVSIIIRLLASDGKISQKEVEYLNKTFGFEYTCSELIDVYDNCKDEIDRSFDEDFENGITYMRKINTKLADAYKELLLLICEIVIQSDGFISSVEKTEVERLKAKCL